METPEASEGIKNAVGKSISGLLPAGHKAAIAAEIFVRGSELGAVMALSVGQGLAIMLALIVAIVAIEYAVHKFLKKRDNALKVAEPTSRKPRGLRRMASMPAGGVRLGRGLRRAKAPA